jgi:hypothetical protein
MAQRQTMKELDLCEERNRAWDGRSYSVCGASSSRNASQRIGRGDEGVYSIQIMHGQNSRETNCMEGTA